MTSALDFRPRTSSCNFRSNKKGSSLSPKNNQSQVRSAIADEHSAYAWYMNISITTYNSNNCNSLAKSKPQQN